MYKNRAASVFVKLFISGNERCHTTDFNPIFAGEQIIPVSEGRYGAVQIGRRIYLEIYTVKPLLIGH